MTTWSGTLPTWLAGEEVTGTDLQTMTDAEHALTDAWTDWSPTTANLTLGSGTITARYRQAGKTADIFFLFQLGAGSAVGTLPSFTLPFSLHSSYAIFTPIGHGDLIDSGTAAYFCVGRWTGSVVEVVYLGASGIHSAVTATAPFTWTNGDRFSIHGKSIEIA